MGRKLSELTVGTVFKYDGIIYLLIQRRIDKRYVMVENLSDGTCRHLLFDFVDFVEVIH